MTRARPAALRPGPASALSPVAPPRGAPSERSRPGSKLSLPPEVLERRARRLGFRVQRLAGTAGAEDAPLAAEEMPRQVAVEFPYDADGDGVEEEKRLYVRARPEGGGWEAVLNPDPVPIKDWVGRKLGGDPTLVRLVADVEADLDSSTISTRRGRNLRAHLLQIVQRLHALRNVKKAQRGDSLIRPRTRISQHQMGQISDPATGLNEAVPASLVVDPLSVVPPADAAWTGYGVEQPNTDYMVALKKRGSYVRGHLLNSKLHGPGVDENLVPISSALNSRMRSEFEDDLKAEVNRDLRVFRYEIVPDFGTPPLQPDGNAYTNQDAFGRLPGRIGVRIEPYVFGKAGDKGDLANWRLGPAVVDKWLPHELSFTPRKLRQALSPKTPVQLLKGPAFYTFGSPLTRLSAGSLPALAQKGVGLTGPHSYRKVRVGLVGNAGQTAFQDSSRVYTADPGHGTLRLQGDTLTVIPKDVRGGWIDLAAQFGDSYALDSAINNARRALEVVDGLLSSWVNLELFAVPTLRRAAEEDSDFGRSIAAGLPGVEAALSTLNEKGEPFRELRDGLRLDLEEIHDFRSLLKTIGFDLDEGAAPDQVFRNLLDVQERTEKIRDTLYAVSQRAARIEVAVSSTYPTTGLGRDWKVRHRELQTALGARELREVWGVIERLFPPQVVEIDPPPGDFPPL